MPITPRLISLLLLLPMLVWGETIRLPAGDLKVEDGDTLLVRLEGETKRVQLLGIDAPEDKDNPKFKVDLKRTALDYDTLLTMGVMASDHLRELIAGTEALELNYTPGEIDRYGRLVGVLYGIDGVSINQAMVANGFAVVTLPDEDEKRPAWLERQRRSVEQKRGLWGLLPNPAHRWAGKYLQP